SHSERSDALVRRPRFPERNLPVKIAFPPCSFHRVRVPAQSPVIVSRRQRSISGEAFSDDSGLCSADESFMISSELPEIGLAGGAGGGCCPSTTHASMRIAETIDETKSALDLANI